MPETELVFYEEEDGEAPVLDWFIELRRKNKKAYAACLGKLRMLQTRGHDLRRPHVDMLRDGIYELRIGHQRVNYRILYFFHGENVCVLAHALTKEKKVPAADINRAIKRRKQYEKDPEQHRATRSPQDF